VSALPDPVDPTLDVELRLAAVEILGSARDRRAARLRVGYTHEQIAELTGLSRFVVWYREQVNPDGSDAWRLRRGALTTDEDIRYLDVIRRLRGL
jgi:hypothetical protein